MPKRKISLHAIGNAHIDPVWLWRWPEGLETIRSTFRSALDRMGEFPQFKFTGSSAAFYAQLADVDPDMLDEIRQRVDEGRWEIVGGWWVQPDVNVPCGESLVRQGLYGQRWFERYLGKRAGIGYNPDTFGHPGMLPQILRKAGMSRYVFMRPGEHEKSLPGNVFLWRSLDGSQVLTARIAHSYCTWPEGLAEHVTNCAVAAPDYLSEYMVFYGVGNHGGGPTKQNIGSLLEMSSSSDTIEVKLSTLDSFFSAAEGEIVMGADVSTIEDELQHHARGCYAAHSEVKRENRRVEHLLMTSEKVAAIAWSVFGRPYPHHDLTDAWQSLLFNQFHDILAGTSLNEAYVDARDLFGHSATLADRALNSSLQSLTGRIDTTGEGAALVLFNPLPWKVTVPVEIERVANTITTADGVPLLTQTVQPSATAGQKRQCVVAELPAMGYRLLRQGVGQAAKPSERSLSATIGSLENDFWRLVISPATGHLVSLYDKRNELELLAGPGNVGVVLDDASDTWSHGIDKFNSEIGSFSQARVSLDEQGPVRACLRVETRYGASCMTQRIYLYRDLELIEFRTTVNWQEQLKALKIAFPFKLDLPASTYETPYGYTERLANGNEEPGQQWIAVTGFARSTRGEQLPYGVALLNDSKYSFDVNGAVARMTVLRSPAYAHHDPEKLDSARSYSYIDQGLQTVTYRLAPHPGAWQDAAITRKAMELNVRPIAVNEYTHGGRLPATMSYLETEPDNIVLTVCKKAEDQDALIVRGYETSGRKTAATIRVPYWGVEWQADFGANTIKTWRITGGMNGQVEEVDLLEGTEYL